LPIKFKRKISESGRALRVNIPKEIANYLNIEKGDTVLVYVDNGRMIVEKEKKK
jgi:AbrB family looped-hinge helix DNA binding protein